MDWIFKKNQDVRTKRQDLNLTILIMKNIFFLIAIISVTFISCDGRISKSNALKDSIREFSQKQSEIELVTFYPKEYTEVVTDTLLSNKVKVHIRNYSLDNETIFISSSDKKSPRKVNYHRVFKSDIVVSTPSKEILKTHISAKQFASDHPDDFWDNATLQHVWLNEELSTTLDIHLDISFINPANQSYKLFRMSIDIHGQRRINLIEQRS